MKRRKIHEKERTSKSTADAHIWHSNAQVMDHTEEERRYRKTSRTGSESMKIVYQGTDKGSDGLYMSAVKVPDDNYITMGHVQDELAMFITDEEQNKTRGPGILIKRILWIMN